MAKLNDEAEQGIVPDVETSHGVTIKADLKFEDIASFEDADMLMIPDIGLVKNDPYLADYEDAIKGRHDHALWKLG